MGEVRIEVPVIAMRTLHERARLTDFLDLSAFGLQMY
jgi:hypothetical protein